MAAPAIPCQGITVTITDNAASPQTIAGVVSMTDIGAGEASQHDVTTLASTAHEVRMGLQNFGSFPMTFIWNGDDAGQAAMLDAMDRAASRTMVITLPSTSPSVTLNVWTATVYVTKMGYSVEVDGQVMGTATILVTGEPAWT